MVPPKLIPTRLVPYAERTPIAVVAISASRRPRAIHVVFAFLRWFLHLAWLRLAGRLTGRLAGASLRTLLEQQGFLWIKVGQLLSLRNDVFSAEFCEELSRLQYGVTGFPFGQVRATVEEELGGPLENFFTQFDEHPFAAASISQVHRAILKRTGALVAVKVQRPEVPWIFQRDMALIRRLIDFLAYLRIAPYMRWHDMHWELNQIMVEETDYRYEASHLRRMRRSLRGHRIFVPEIYEALSYRRVLVMEFIQGALMSDFIALRATDPDRLNTWLLENNINPERVGTRLFLSFFRQLMEDNLFHGDLHPGNIVLLRNSRFAFIDLGTIGSLDADFIDLYKQCVEALTTFQFARGVELILLLCPDLPPVNIGELTERLVECYRAWGERAPTRSLPYHERSMMSVTHEASKVMMSFGVVGSMTFLKLTRTWATLDASLNYLIPNVNYSKLIPQYYQGKLRRARKRPLRRRLTQGIIRVKETLDEYRELVEPLMRQRVLWFRGGTSTLNYSLGTLAGGLRLFAGVAALLYLCAIVERVRELPLSAWLQDIVRKLPAPPVPAGRFFVFVALLLLYYYLNKIVQRFLAEEVRLPTTFFRS